ncbi:ATP-grasp domain-containing protein [Streptomyces sp. NPDC014861]|uniref:ATP-grasp domain-containing protein n=1 Tax=Streptomyces sp. NPDC014861 TaxID=3364923 RepID=UPI0036FB157E
MTDLAPDPAPAARPGRAAVLVLGGGTRLPAALRGHGRHVVYFGTPEEFTPAHHEACDEAWLLSGGSEDAWVRRAVALHREVPFQQVVTVRERFLVAAARITDALGLGGNSLDTVRTLKDKALMRESLRALSGEGGVRAGLMRTGADVDAFAAESGLPLVLKPRDGSGSEGVLVARGEEDLAAARARVEREPGALLAEEFLDGPEFSVETFSRAGIHEVLAVTEKFTDSRRVEIGHVVPARVDEERRAALADAACRFLEAVGLAEGPAHTEIILTAAGPRVVESHNRPGGDGIVDLVRHVTGRDVRDLLAARIAGVDVAPASGRAGAAATWFMTADPGVVAEVTGLETAAGHEGVVGVSCDVERGDEVRPTASSGDRCGSVTALGGTADEALARARAAAAAVVIRREEA